MAAAGNAAGSEPFFRRTQLWPIASLGSVPMFVSVTFRSSPGLASIEARLNFMLSPAVSSIERGPVAAAGVAEAAVPDEPAVELSFWPQPEAMKAVKSVARRNGILIFIARKPLVGRRRKQTRRPNATSATHS